MRTTRRRSVVLGLGAAALALAWLPQGGAAALSVEARLARSQLAVGEATSLELVVRGAAGGVREPEFDVPEGLEVLGTGRSQNFTWVNGRSSVEILFRYEISASAAGRYALGPIVVRAGKEAFRSGVLTLDVSAAPARLGGSGSGNASLIADVIPPEPWQGQPCQLRVRLIQRAPLAADPQYSPPATPGFWAEKPGPPESYYADERGRRVLVTESRTRIYPLAAGTATVGEASATLALAVLPPGGGPWLGGGAPRREEVVRSRPVTVQVRPLPPGAPAGFSGAVGSLAIGWTADRARTTVDVPVTLRLDVRGIGNLPLVRPPGFTHEGIDVFASTLEDSLPGGTGEAPGRRRFQWTVVPRKPGKLDIEPPPFAWFDPATGRYRRAAASPIRLEVGPAMFADSVDSPGLPAVFARHPIDPGARPAKTAGWALAGLLAAGGIALWRRAGPAPGAGAERARVREWLRLLERTSGPDFWRAAEESGAWLESRGRALGTLRREIAAARYAGTRADPQALRGRIVGHLSAALPPAGARRGRRAAAVALVVLAAACCAYAAPRAGDARARALARAADQAARQGEVARASASWTELWHGGARHPGLAARLAWVESQAGEVGAAAAWVLRGENLGGRDAALDWVGRRVREGGGLLGGGRVHWPVRPLEWGLAALALGALAGFLWPARGRTAVALALVVACGAIDPLQGARVAHLGRAVVVAPVRIEGEGLELQPGQVVRVRERRAGRARISAGAGIDGWIPAEAIDTVGGTR